MLKAYRLGENVEVFPGYFIEQKNLPDLLAELNKPLYVLDQHGEDIRSVELTPDAVFILGDHKGLPDIIRN